MSGSTVWSASFEFSVHRPAAPSLRLQRMRRGSVARRADGFRRPVRVRPHVGPTTVSVPAALRVQTPAAPSEWIQRTREEPSEAVAKSATAHPGYGPYVGPTAVCVPLASSFQIPAAPSLGASTTNGLWHPGRRQEQARSSGEGPVGRADGGLKIARVQRPNRRRPVASVDSRRAVPSDAAATSRAVITSEEPKTAS